MIYLGFMFGILAFLIYNVNSGNAFFTNIDTKVLDIFHSIRSNGLDHFYTTVTWLGSLWILFPLFSALIIYLLVNGYKTVAFGLGAGFWGLSGQPMP